MDRHSRAALLYPREPVLLPMQTPPSMLACVHSPRPRQAKDETQARYRPCYDATYAPYTDHVSHQLCGMHYRPSFCHPLSIHLQVQPPHGPRWIGIASRLRRNHYTVESSTHNTRHPLALTLQEKPSKRTAHSRQPPWTACGNHHNLPITYVREYVHAW